MNAIRLIEEWCAAQGMTFVYGSNSQIGERLTYADYAASAGGVVVFATLLTSGTYDGGKDHDNAAVYFSALTDFDFDPLQVADLQASLRETSKGLLRWLLAGNAAVWSGARYTYGYDDYAENVCWCCLRFTLDGIVADCVELPQPPAVQVRMMPLTARAAMESLVGTGELTEICGGIQQLTHEGRVVALVAVLAADAQVCAWMTSDSGEEIAAACEGVEVTEEYIDTIPPDIPAEAVEEVREVMGWYLIPLFSDAGPYDGTTFRLCAGGTAEDPRWCGEWCTVEGE